MFARMFGGGNPPKTEEFRNALQKYATAVRKVKNLENVPGIMNDVTYSKPLLNSIERAFTANNKLRTIINNSEVTQQAIINQLKNTTVTLNEVTKKALIPENLNNIMTKITKNIENNSKANKYLEIRGNKIRNNSQLNNSRGNLAKWKLVLNAARNKNPNKLNKSNPQLGYMKIKDANAYMKFGQNVPTGKWYRVNNRKYSKGNNNIFAVIPTRGESLVEEAAAAKITELNKAMILYNKLNNPNINAYILSGRNASANNLLNRTRKNGERKYGNFFTRVASRKITKAAVNKVPNNLGPTRSISNQTNQPNPPPTTFFNKARRAAGGALGFGKGK